MQEKIREIAARIRELRELSDISADEMAGSLGLAPDIYKKYETAEEDIPASILFEIAGKLKVEMSVLLTGKDPHMNVFTVTRRGEGIGVERRSEYKYEALAANFIHKKAELFVVTVESGQEEGDLHKNSHPGQEFNYLLEGELVVYIHDHEIRLKTGDSIFFDSGYSHAMRAVGDKPAKFLAIIL